MVRGLPWLQSMRLQERAARKGGHERGFIAELSRLYLVKQGRPEDDGDQLGKWAAKPQPAAPGRGCTNNQLD